MTPREIRRQARLAGPAPCLTDSQTRMQTALVMAGIAASMVGWVAFFADDRTTGFACLGLTLAFVAMSFARGIGIFIAALVGMACVGVIIGHANAPAPNNPVVEASK